MSRYNNKELIASVQNGDKEVIVFLAQKYFPLARKILRTKGIPDSQTPQVFNRTLVRVCREIVRGKFTPSVEFEPYLLNSLDEAIQDEKKSKSSENKLKETGVDEMKTEVIAQCVSILDEQAKALVQAYYADKMSFESIALKFNYSNAVIAQHEVNKALRQLEGIVSVRLNIALN